MQWPLFIIFNFGLKQENLKKKWKKRFFGWAKTGKHGYFCDTPTGPPDDFSEFYYFFHTDDMSVMCLSLLTNSVGLNPYTAKEGGVATPPCSFSPVSFSRIFFHRTSPYSRPYIPPTHLSTFVMWVPMYPALWRHKTWRVLELNFRYFSYLWLETC